MALNVLGCDVQVNVLQPVWRRGCRTVCAYPLKERQSDRTALQILTQAELDLELIHACMMGLQSVKHGYMLSQMAWESCMMWLCTGQLVPLQHAHSGVIGKLSCRSLC